MNSLLVLLGDPAVQTLLVGAVSAVVGWYARHKGVFAPASPPAPPVAAPAPAPKVTNPAAKPDPGVALAQALAEVQAIVAQWEQLKNAVVPSGPSAVTAAAVKS